jgi:hypothetical protein
MRWKRLFATAGFVVAATMLSGCQCMERCFNGPINTDPGVFSGLVQILKIDASATQSVVGYAVTDDMDPHTTWWLIDAPYGYPVDLQPNESLKIVFIDAMPRNRQALCDWHADPGNTWDDLNDPTMVEVRSDTLSETHPGCQ